MVGWFLSQRESAIVARHEVPRPFSQRGRRTQHRGSNPELSTPFVGGKSASSDLPVARIHSPAASSFPLEAPLNGANGTQAGSLCYINAVASSLQVHGIAPEMALGDRSTVRKANVA
jgi:hypothetical protein